MTNYLYYLVYCKLNHPIAVQCSLPTNIVVRLLLRIKLENMERNLSTNIPHKEQVCVVMLYDCKQRYSDVDGLNYMYTLWCWYIKTSDIETSFSVCVWITVRLLIITWEYVILCFEAVWCLLHNTDFGNELVLLGILSTRLNTLWDFHWLPRIIQDNKHQVLFKLSCVNIQILDPYPINCAVG
jgi:hypothetical protein